MVNLKDELTLDASLLHGEKRFIPSTGVEAHQEDAISYHQPICPYISSSFVDLEEEFKYLHAHVFPQLDKLCQERRSHFLPLDFRRTAIENRSSADSILKHSLDTVLSSLPYFICVLGSQYGAHRLPSSESLTSVARSASGQLSMIEQNFIVASQTHQWLLQRDFQTCSMTELEVTLACFLSSTHAPKHCFFYIQETLPVGDQSPTEALLESESDFAQKSLYELKSKIVNKGLPVKFFVTKEELAEKVLTDWTEIIFNALPAPSICTVTGDEHLTQLQLQESLLHNRQRKYYKSNKLRQLEERLTSHAFAVCECASTMKSGEGDLLCDDDLYSKDEASVAGFKIGDGIFSSAEDFLNSINIKADPDTDACKESSIVAVVGEPGSGKTCFLANWLSTFRQDFPDVLILSEFVGNSYLSHDLSLFLRRCIRTLREKYFGIKSTSLDLLSNVDSYEELIETFSSALHLLPCLIVIDNLNDLNQLMGQDIGVIKALDWLPKSIPSTCKVIVTTRKSDLSFKVLQARDDVTITWIPTLKLETKKRLFFTHLEPHLANTLSLDLTDKIWSNKLSEFPLYLVVLSDLLAASRMARDVLQVVERCTSLRTIRNFWKCVFVLWSHRHSWNKNSPGQPGSIRGRNSAAGWVVDALKLLAASRFGLHRNEIVHLLSIIGYRGRATVTPSDWDMFQVTAGSLLETGSDGLVHVNHQAMLIAIRNMLYKAGRSARADFSFIKSKRQRFHSILGSYFLKFGSMDRKLAELPWQLQQSADWLTLCQVLCKPRFFLAMCEKSKHVSWLYADHVTYWKELVKHDFDVYHCLQAMLEPRSSDDDELVIGREDEMKRSVQPTIVDRDSRNKPPVTISVKAPSVIIVTQHDDGSVHRSTEDSKSETEDRDYSDTGSSSFFITDAEVDHHLPISGWNPGDDIPECSIDDFSWDEDLTAVMRERIAWLLYQIGEPFRERANDVVQSAIDLLNLSRPLSHRQLLVFFELVVIGCRYRYIKDIDVQMRAIDTFNELSLKTLNLSFVTRRDLHESAAGLRLRVAGKLMKQNRHQEARSLILNVFRETKRWTSAFCKVQASRMFGKLLMNINLISQSEEMLISSFAICAKWRGKMHVDLAGILKDLARLYSFFFPADRAYYRRAMLCYKQALEVYQFNHLPLKAAKVSKLIAQLLASEGSFMSKKEASACFLKCLDAYVTNQAASEDDVMKINRQYKKVVSDLATGRYVYGSGKPPDRRSPERPYSTLSWRPRELSRLSEKEDISPHSIMDIKTNRSLMSSIAVQRPYSAFSGKSYANYVLVTPKQFEVQRPAASSIATRASSRQRTPFSTQPREYVRSEKSSRDHLLYDSLGEPQTSVVTMSLVSQRPETTEGKEHPVIIVSGQTGRSVSDREDTTRSDLQRPEAQFPPDATARSQVSTPKRSVRLHTKPHVINQTSRPSPPKHHCNFTSLSLSVHGPHSTIDDVINIAPSSINERRSVDVYHKAAWFHVPGRYTKPGEVLPSKRSQFQKRPTSSSANSTYYRSRPTSRSLSRQEKLCDDSIFFNRSDSPLAETPVKIRIDNVDAMSSKELFVQKQS